MLASSFARTASQLRADRPLSDDVMRQVAPSIFAVEKHDSRSARYTYIPTIDVLQGLRKEGFEPFMAAQSRSRVEGKAEFTKHMVRLRHASQINAGEANEIILINSHDGTSSYQMLAGMFRFVCCNGMVCGDVVDDVRVPHKGNVIDNVIEGATRILGEFDRIGEHRDAMRAVTLTEPERVAFGAAAVALRWAPPAPDAPVQSAPVTPRQVVAPRRSADIGSDLWSTFNVVQENLLRGGMSARTRTGRRMTVRSVQGIDSNVALNRGLWTLAEEMRKLKA